MFSSKRIRLAAASAAVAIAAAGIGVGVASAASASAAKPASAARPAAAAHHQPKLSIKRFDLTGWVIDAKYTLGRNTGNTFEQTYKGSTVQGVPIAGPFVGSVFPPVDYVALPVGDDQVYVSWLDPATFAIVDAFVFNFKTHTVYDYAPGSASPESAGTITVKHAGKNRIP
jgi:hypothetical protein